MLISAMQRLSSVNVHPPTLSLSRNQLQILISIFFFRLMFRIVIEIDILMMARQKMNGKGLLGELLETTQLLLFKY